MSEPTKKVFSPPSSFIFIADESESPPWKRPNKRKQTAPGQLIGAEFVKKKRSKEYVFNEELYSETTDSQVSRTFANIRSEAIKPEPIELEFLPEFLTQAQRPEEGGKGENEENVEQQETDSSQVEKPVSRGADGAEDSVLSPKGFSALQKLVDETELEKEKEKRNDVVPHTPPHLGHLSSFSDGVYSWNRPSQTSSSSTFVPPQKIGGELTELDEMSIQLYTLQQDNERLLHDYQELSLEKEDMEKGLTEEFERRIEECLLKKEKDFEKRLEEKEKEFENHFNQEKAEWEATAKSVFETQTKKHLAELKHVKELNRAEIAEMASSSAFDMEAFEANRAVAERELKAKYRAKISELKQKLEDANVELLNIDRSFDLAVPVTPEVEEAYRDFWKSSDSWRYDGKSKSVTQISSIPSSLAETLRQIIRFGLSPQIAHFYNRESIRYNESPFAKMSPAPVRYDLPLIDEESDIGAVSKEAIDLGPVKEEKKEKPAKGKPVKGKGRSEDGN